MENDAKKFDMQNNHQLDLIVIKNITISFLITFTKIIFPIVSFVYSNRVLGADGIGRVSFSKSIVSYFMLVAALGIKNYGIRETAKKKDKESISKLFWDLTFINLFSTVLSYVIFLLLLLSSVFEPYKSLLIVTGMAILFNGMNYEWLYIGLEKYKVLALRTLFVQLLSFMLLILFVKKTSDIIMYALISTLSSYGVSLLNFVGVRKYIYPLKKYKPSIKQHLGPILWLFAFAVSIELYTVLDTSMLGMIKGDKEVGLYVAAMRINKIVVELIASIGIALMPRLSYSFENESMYYVERKIVSSCNLGFAFSIPACVGIGVLSEEIIDIFAGNDFADAAFTMRVISPIIIIITFSGMMIKQVLIPMRKDKYVLVATGFAAFINVILNLNLIPRYGRNGAAFATVAAELSACLVSFYYARKNVKIHGIAECFHQYILASIPIVLIKWCVTCYVSNSVLIIMLTTFMSVAAYFAMLCLFKNTIAIGITHMFRDYLKKRLL